MTFIFSKFSKNFTAVCSSDKIKEIIVCTLCFILLYVFYFFINFYGQNFISGVLMNQFPFDHWIWIEGLKSLVGTWTDDCLGNTITWCQSPIFESKSFNLTENRYFTVNFELVIGIICIGKTLIKLYAIITAPKKMYWLHGAIAYLYRLGNLIRCFFSSLISPKKQQQNFFQFLS